MKYRAVAKKLKALGCVGDGGMVVTNDKDLAERVEMLRRHGGKVKYRHSELGLNSRLDELPAAILRVKFKHLEQWIDARRRIAYRYNELLFVVALLKEQGILAEKLIKEGHFNTAVRRKSHGLE